MGKKKRMTGRRVLALMVSVVLCCSTAIMPAQTVKAASIAIPGAEYTIGQMLYGLFSAGGVTTTTSLVNDSLFSDKYSIQSMIDRGMLVPIEGGDINNLDDYDWTNVWDQIDQDAGSGKSNYAKNVVKPVGNNFNALGPSDPNNWKKNLRQWLVAIGMAGSINASLSGGLQPVSNALQNWSQPYVQYGLPLDSSSASFSKNLDLESLLKKLPNLQFDASYNFTRYVGNWTYDSSGRGQDVFALPEGVESVLCNGPTDIYSPGIYLLSNQPFTYGRYSNWTRSYFYKNSDFLSSHNLYYFCPLSPSYVNPQYFFGIFGSYTHVFNSVEEMWSYYAENPIGNSNLTYAPNIINKDGNVYNINNIYPVLNSGQTMQIPSKEHINNYINNVNNTTNQGDIINYYNDYINNIVKGHSTDPPVNPPVSPPVVQPSGIPQPSPPPEDDTNEKFLAPNLKDYFPFCIPFDLYDIFKNFSSSRTAPKFTFRLKSEKYGIDIPIDVDLSKFDSAAEILRTLELILFIILLAVATRKLIGAG